MKYFALMLVSILFFGCAAQPAAEGNKSPAQAHQNGTVPAQDEGALNATTNATAYLPPVNASEENLTSATGGKYAGMDFAALAATGEPLECVITYTYSGREVSAKAFMKGAGEFRVESPVGMTQCGKTITIVRGGRTYAGCEGKMAMPSCDWLRSDYDSNEAGLTATIDLRGAEFDCAQWEYSSSKFATPGEVCHLDFQ